MPCERIAWMPDGVGDGLGCDEGYSEFERCISCTARATLDAQKVAAALPQIIDDARQTHVREARCSRAKDGDVMRDDFKAMIATPEYQRSLNAARAAVQNLQREQDELKRLKLRLLELAERKVSA